MTEPTLKRSRGHESAVSALRIILARIEGTAAADWVAPNPRTDPAGAAQYAGTLAEFIRAAIVGERP